MVKIVPAIIAKDINELEKKISLVKEEADLIQLDIMDNKFVPNKTWRKPDELERRGDSPKMEAHLMIKNPHKFIKKWLKSPVKRFLVHWESFNGRERIKEINKLIDSVHKNKKEIGIALNPESDWREIEPFIANLDAVLFLSVHPGFYGKKFQSDVVTNIKSLRKKYKNVIIEIDGGIKLSNLKKVISSGVDRVVVGSALFYAENPLTELKKFKKIAESGDK